MFEQIRKQWRYRGVYPEVGENGWQIGVRFPERISAKRRGRILTELGLSADVFGFDSYNAVKPVEVRTIDAGYEVEVRYRDAWPKLRLHFIGSSVDDTPPQITRAWSHHG